MAATTTSDFLTRREAIRRVSALLGGAGLIAQGAWLQGCEAGRWARSSPGEPFAALEIELLDELAETILPDPNTPSAMLVLK